MMRRVREKYGIWSLAGLTVFLLSFLLCVHVSTCASSYNDDVCGGARIESALQIAAQKIGVGKAKDKCASECSGERIAISPLPFEVRTASSSTGASFTSYLRESSSRNSALSHRQTIVLLI